MANQNDSAPKPPVDRPLVADGSAELAFQKWAAANGLYPDERRAARKAFYAGWALRRQSRAEVVGFTLRTLGWMAMFAYVVNIIVATVTH
jgi:hypothetical protein